MRKPDSSDGGSAIIVGAGPVGLFAAAAFAKIGRQVTVFESHEDSRKDLTVGRRSINISLSRGLEPLQWIGAQQAILEHSVPMSGRHVHLRTGQEIEMPYSPDGVHSLQTITRGKVVRVLTDLVDQLPDVDLQFEHECMEVEFNEGRIKVRDAEGHISTHEADIILICDGVNSSLRRAFCEASGGRYEAWPHHYGYKKLTLPRETLQNDLRPDRVHLWPGGRALLMALSNQDDTFNCTLTMPFHGARPSFDAVQTEEDIDALVRDYFPSLISAVTKVTEDYRDNPVSKFNQVRLSRWHHKDRAFMLGDASFAVLPWYSQGLNASFNIAMELAKSIAEKGQRRALPSTEKKWRGEIEAIRRMSSENFLTLMRHLNDPAYWFTLQAQNELERRHPGELKGLYSMVAFSDIPYSRIEQIAYERASIIRAHLVGASSLADVDFELLIEDLRTIT